MMDLVKNKEEIRNNMISRQFKGYDLEEFIADLLGTMGYRTTLSPHGGDSGIDITAYKDELPPRILVQVKSGNSDIKETTIQSLKGAMREGDYCLFITLANYTKNAQKYLDSNRFFRCYKDYQEKKYPQLSLRTSRESNGYWAHYTTRFGSVYLHHKITEGNVDLTFGKASKHMDKLEIVAAWLRKHGIGGVSSVITGKAGALRISVPKLNMQIPFDENDEYNIDVCFKTISELIEVANVFEAAKEVSDL